MNRIRDRKRMESHKISSELELLYHEREWDEIRANGYSEEVFMASNYDPSDRGRRDSDPDDVNDQFNEDEEYDDESDLEDEEQKE